MSVNISDRLESEKFQGKISYDFGKTGVVSFSGHVYLKDLSEETIKDSVARLFAMHQAVEGVFKVAGYTVAGDKNKMPGSKLGGSDKQE